MSYSAPDFATQAALGASSVRFFVDAFNAREQKLCQSVKAYVDSISPDTVITTQGDIIVGNVSGNAARLAKGSSGLPLVAGASTVSYAALAAAGLASGAVTLAKLDAGVVYSHRVFAAGTFTTVGGDANESITATGALATDLAFVEIRTVGGTPRTIVSAIAATNAINVVFSGDPAADHVVCWQLLRAAA